MTNQVAKNNFQHAEVLLSYDGGWYQQSVAEQTESIPDKSTWASLLMVKDRMDVHVRTNGHKNQNGRILMGSYVVKSTVACIAN